MPLATGENLVSHLDALNLARYGGLDPQRDYLQFDCALSYGLVEYLRTLEALAPLGWEPRRLIPDGVTVDEGYITMPELPGIGFEGKADLAQVCAELAG
ncbi:hypothetical protein [Serinicoccus marinus]|uniref:hypothetical protein n=1 Tax=Serinicoccus marinus TaxID=247333 RepID=UPI002492FBC1|nr:hypothetical protein [Serinicoccus marinus]